MIARGASELLTTLKKVPHVRQPGWLIFFIVTTCSVYVLLLVNKVIGAEDDVYFLPTWVVIFTIALPYLYAWSRVMQGMYDLTRYLSVVKGKLYKNALGAVVTGLSAVTILNILIQLFMTASTRLTRLNLTPLIVIVYLLVFCYAIGFGLMARGSRKLIKIEEA